MVTLLHFAYKVYPPQEFEFDSVAAWYSVHSKDSDARPRCRDTPGVPVDRGGHAPRNEQHTSKRFGKTFLVYYFGTYT